MGQREGGDDQVPRAILSYRLFFEQVTGPNDGEPVHAAGTTTLDGRSVAVYATAQGDRFYLAASGPAYLLREDAAADNHSAGLKFTWNQPVAVTAPLAADTVG